MIKTYFLTFLFMVFTCSLGHSQEQFGEVINLPQGQYLNLRTKPHQGESSQVLLRFTPGKKLTILGRPSGAPYWYEAEYTYQGKLYRGYVSGHYIKLEKALSYEPCNTSKHKDEKGFLEDLIQPSAQDCHNPVDLLYGGLEQRPDLPFKKQASSFWAQSAIGSPEAKEFLDNAEFAVKPNMTKVGIKDSVINLATLAASRLSPEVSKKMQNPDWKKKLMASSASRPDEHGTQVVNLILGEFPFGVSFYGSLGGAVSSLPSRPKEMASFLNKELGDSQVINMSIGVSLNVRNSEGRKTLLGQMEKSSLLVVSAGNDFPLRIHPVDSQSQAILVGNIDVTGEMQSDSQEDPAVVISAPSGVSILSKSSRGVDRFSGTSAAAPLVTGAISNVQAFLPGINRHEIVALLQQTAIPTHAFADGNKMNGAGGLNMYKMIRVAHSLSKDWPSNRNNVFDREIYHFDSEVEELRKKIEEISAIRNLSCEQELDLLKLLRKSFFLNPEDQKVRRQLYNIYSKNGYGKEARYYQIPEETSKTRHRKLFRAVIFNDEKGLNEMIAIDESFNPYQPHRGYHRINLIRLASLYGHKEVIMQLIENGAIIKAEELDNLIAGSNTHPKSEQEIIHLIKESLRKFPELKRTLVDQPYIYTAVLGRKKEITKFLLSVDANPSAGKNSSSPLELALSFHDLELLEDLLEAGAEPNITLNNKEQDSILLKAISMKKVRAVKLLLKYRANPHFKNAEGQNALDLVQHLKSLNPNDLYSARRLDEINSILRPKESF